MEQKITQPQIKLTDTKLVADENGKPIILAEGTIFRKGNRFISGGLKDPIIPIPVFYNIQNNKILLDTIPTEIRKEYEDVGFSLD